MATVLFVGAGRHQRRAILRARELGLRVVAVDANPDALGATVADVAEPVDFRDVAGVTDVARRHGVEGVLTISADRAVPVVAAVAETLGLPGIGLETARRMTHKGLMRSRLAEAGVPQPRFALVAGSAEAHAAFRDIGPPLVLKPANSGGQRGIFRIETEAELDRFIADSIAESPTGEAIVERFHEGLELNGLAVARRGEVMPLTLSDRLRPPGAGFGVGWIHLYPASIDAATLAEAERVVVEAVRALGMRDGIAFPQLLVCDDGVVRVVEVAARIPGGQMADLARHAVGVELVDVALRQALGEEVSDDLVVPRYRQPLAIRFLTARPGPLPAGRVRSVGPLDPVLAAPGVVQAELYFGPGETIRPVQVDADRRGYVIALGETSAEALERAEAAARLLPIEVEPPCPFDPAHFEAILHAASTGGYSFALFGGEPKPGEIYLRHDVDFSLAAALELARTEREFGVRATFLLMTESVFYNLASREGREAIAELRALGHAVGLHGAWPNATLDERFDPVFAWHNPSPEHIGAPVDGALNVMNESFSANYRSDSNQRWRHGCPCADLAAGRFEWLQLLLHPEIWVYEGETMRETMATMLEAEQARRLEQLREDRIDLS